MKIAVILVVIVIFLQFSIVSSENQNLQEVTVYHMNLLNKSKNAELIIEYYGEKSAIYSYFSQFGLQVERIGEFYKIFGNAKSFLNALNVEHNKTYLPNSISENLGTVYFETNVSSNIMEAKDPYPVNDLIEAYSVNKLINYGFNGKNFTAVVIVPFGDPNITENLMEFNNMYNLGPLNLTVKYFISRPTVYPSQWVLETDLDVETIHAFAPGANIILAVSPDDNVSSLENVLKTIVDQKLGNVISLSWGGPENEIYDPYFHQILKEAAYNGITVIASSGDSPIVEYPSSDPYVVSVGGTTLHIDNGTYLYESLWAESGGGYSEIFQRPSWQFFLNSTGRGVPDISLDGNPQTGVYIYSDGMVGVGGTSLSAPIFTGMILDLYSRLQFSLGYFLPQLYYMDYYNSTFFHTVYIQGNVTKWNQQTGLGSPNIYSWNFPVLNFSASAFLGNYSDLKNIYFNLRGFSETPMHTWENNSFYVQIQSENSSIKFGIYDTKKDSSFFYEYNSQIKYLSIKVIENSLYNVTFQFLSNGTFLTLNNSVFFIPVIIKNASIYTFALSQGHCSFYTNLGPVEFRNFYVNGINVKSAYVLNKNFTLYGAMEIPFIENDFLIGNVVKVDRILWPGNYNYIYTGPIILKNEMDLSNYSFIVGTGKSYDPYILSGLILNSTGSSNYLMILDLSGYYLINRCYNNLSDTSILFAKNVILKIENSKFSLSSSNLGIYLYSSTAYFQNVSIMAGVPILAFYSNIFVENSSIYLFPILFGSFINIFNMGIIFFIVPIFVLSPYYILAILLTIIFGIYLLKRRF